MTVAEISVRVSRLLGRYERDLAPSLSLGEALRPVAVQGFVDELGQLEHELAVEAAVEAEAARRAERAAA